MTNAQFMTYETPDGETIEFVVIDRGNGEFTSMPKSVYEAQQSAQVEHLTENVPTNE